MRAVENVEAHIADAVKTGAKVGPAAQPVGTRRHLFATTVLTDVTTDIVITKEETCGPVAPLHPFPGR
jgi:succinate-semialdehyde dehydrogenase/glutarate-semialdehyde dehydrogenase